MAMTKDAILQFLAAGIPEARIEIIDLAGDGDHYEVHVWSEAFRGKSRVQQHQMIHQALEGRVGQELHALAIKTFLPEDYQEIKS